MRGKPVLGALEQNPGQQTLAAVLLGHPLIIVAGSIDAGLADQELTFLLKPARKLRPHPEQGFMRHFDDGYVVLHYDHQEPHVGQATQ